MSDEKNSGSLTRLLKEKFPDAIQDSHDYQGDETIIVDRNSIVPICQFLRDDDQCKMEMMIDLTAVDYLGKTPRYEVVYHLKSLSLEHRIRIKVPISEEECHIDSITLLWKAVDWYERECFDMYGITFNGHPNLKRILMYPEFEGYPLRKDYPVDKQQPMDTDHSLYGSTQLCFSSIM